MPLPWIGGKNRISGFILPHIPKNIEVLTESFGGMAWVFLKSDLNEFKNLKKYVYNDLNKLNVNLFNCLKENYQELYKLIKDIPSQNKKMFDEFQKEIFDDNFIIDLSKPNYDIAIKYSYVVSQVFSGGNPSKSNFIDLKGKYKSKFDSFKNKLTDQKFIDHFNRITNVENLDFEELIKKYDGDNTCHYCDPPYVLDGQNKKKGGEQYYCNHDFTIETHERLAKTLHNVKGKFALSYYYFPQLEEWFPKDKYHWEQKEFAKAASAKKGKEQNKGTELLIMNY